MFLSTYMSWPKETPHTAKKNMLNCLQLTCWRSKEACGVTQTFLQDWFNKALMHSHCACCTVTVPKNLHMQTGGVWMVLESHSPVTHLSQILSWLFNLSPSSHSRQALISRTSQLNSNHLSQQPNHLDFLLLLSTQSFPLSSLFLLSYSPSFLLLLIFSSNINNPSCSCPVRLFNSQVLSNSIN